VEADSLNGPASEIFLREATKYPPESDVRSFAALLQLLKKPLGVVGFAEKYHKNRVVC
jgi:hypothetical protein